jgi:hypothetical protein
MGNGGTRISVSNRDGFVLNQNIKGLRLSCFVFLLAVGILFTLAGVWLSMQGTSFEMAWDGPTIASIQPLSFYPGIGMLFFGIISLVFAFDFTSSEWSYYYTYYNLKYSLRPKLENGRVLYGFFSRKIVRAVDDMDDKTKGGLLLVLLTDIPYALVVSIISVLLLALASAAANLIFVMSLNGLVLLSVVIIVLLGCLSVQRACRPRENRLPQEPTYVPLPPGDPITGSWSSFNQHIKLVFQENGTFEMIVTSFDGKDSTYSSGTATDNKHVCFGDNLCLASRQGNLACCFFD